MKHTDSTQMQHTPGPWQAASPDDLEQKGVPVFARNPAGLRYYIATCSYMGTADPAPALANARLIAAAPALLDALRAIATQAGLTAIAFPNAPGNEDLQAIVRITREAIESTRN